MYLYPFYVKPNYTLAKVNIPCPKKNKDPSRGTGPNACLHMWHRLRGRELSDSELSARVQVRDDNKV
jgi:hypothetical protein